MSFGRVISMSSLFLMTLFFGIMASDKDASASSNSAASTKADSTGVAKVSKITETPTPAPKTETLTPTPVPAPTTTPIATPTPVPTATPVPSSTTASTMAPEDTSTSTSAATPAPTATPAPVDKTKTPTPTPSDTPDIIEKGVDSKDSGKATADSSDSTNDSVSTDDVKDGDGVKKAKKADSDDASDVHVDAEGIDTVDVKSGGNWLLKRVWWQKGLETYEKTKTWLKKVLDTRVGFYVKRNNLESEIDAFYLKVGFEGGGSLELTKSLKRAMNDIREEEGALDLNERKVSQKLIDHKKKLEALQKKIKTLQSVDKAVEDALDRLTSRIDQSRSYESESWAELKKIGKVLDDTEAKKHYYNIKGNLENIQNEYSYITKSFANYYNQIIQKARASMNEIQKSMDDLKAVGITLKSTVAKAKDKAEEEEQRKEDMLREQLNIAKDKLKRSETETFFGKAKILFVDDLPEFFVETKKSAETLISNVYFYVKGLFSKGETEVKTALAKREKSVSVQKKTVPVTGKKIDKKASI